MPSLEYTILFKSLLKRLREQTEALDHRLSNEQLSNLTFAFRKILPKTPDEMAFVIAVRLQQKSTLEVVNEYLRKRRKKNNVFIPYNKVKGIHKALAKTCYVLIYKEQAEEILKELTGRYGDLPATIFLDIDVLAECLTKNYRERLSERDIEKISKDLR